MWRSLLRHVEARDADAADRAMQEIIFQSRDQALAVMDLPQGSRPDPRRLLHAL